MGDGCGEFGGIDLSLGIGTVWAEQMLYSLAELFQQVVLQEDSQTKLFRGEVSRPWKPQAKTQGSKKKKVVKVAAKRAVGAAKAKNTAAASPRAQSKPESSVADAQKP